MLNAYTLFLGLNLKIRSNFLSWKKVRTTSWKYVTNKSRTHDVRMLLTLSTVNERKCIFSSCFRESKTLSECRTLDGKLNSLRKPKSSPVASSLWSLVSEAALTKLSVGHIPSQVGPRTDVQLAQSSFSNWKHTDECVHVRRRKDLDDLKKRSYTDGLTSATLMFCLRPRGASKNSCSLAPVFTCSSLPVHKHVSTYIQHGILSILAC